MTDEYLSDPAWAGLFAKAEQLQDLRWAREHLLFAAADTARELVTRDKIEHWLTFGNLRYPQLNVSYHGTGAPVTTFTRSRPLGTSQLTGAAHADDILAHLGRGASLILSNLEHYDRDIALLCRDLGGALGAPIQAYAYLTPPDQSGTRAHRDPADVFAIQVEGGKRWTLFDVPTVGWRGDDIDENTPVTEDVVLAPGDALYVPWAMGHRVQAGPEGSLHLTLSIGVPRVSRVVDVLAGELRSLFDRDEAFPPGDAGRVDVVRDALRRLSTAIDNADPEAIAAQVTPRNSWPVEPRRLPW